MKQWVWAMWTAVVLAVVAAGCTSGPKMLPPEEQKAIDRRYVEYPAGTVLTPFVKGLTGPSALCFDQDGTLLIAESGDDYNPARIYGFRTKDGKSEYFDVVPKGRRFPFQSGFEIYGPIGGMVAAHGKIYVAHRDEDGRGMITRFDYDGNHKTLVADLPARGDFGVTDIAVAPGGRLYFGVGAATNSGVVGLDNMGWLRRNRDVCDHCWTEQPGGFVFLNGWRFNTSNPFAGLFGGGDVTVTAPFQPFGQSIETRIARASTGKPNAAIYSIDPEGGDLRVFCHGIRCPAGIRFNEYGALYFTNQGMKLRGTRPVKDDPDAILKGVDGQWYGWPDYSASLLPIQEPKFQPPQEMLVKSGYRELAFLIDHGRSRLTAPEPRARNLLAAEFAPLSGASKFDFVPGSGSLGKLRQNRNLAVVALNGDRAPYDTSGLKLIGPIGYKLVLVDVDTRQVQEFVRNTQEGPGSIHKNGDTSVELERPIDAKFGPDGALYILDHGRLDLRGSEPRVSAGTGRILRLSGVAEGK